MLETYSHLFIDSLFASLILPIRSEMMFHAMVIFDEFDSFLIFLTALLASITGLAINWRIGKALIFLKKSQAFKDKDKEIKKVETIWNKYVIWLLPIAVFNSIGPVLCLFSGFFRTNIAYLIILTAIGKTAYYYLNFSLTFH